MELRERPTNLRANGSNLDLQNSQIGGIGGRTPQETVKMKEKHLTVVIKLGTALVNTLGNGMQDYDVLTVG